MKSKFSKFLKGIVYTLCLLIIIIFSIYTAAWFTFTKRAEITLSQIFHNPSFTVTGDIPTFSNYPFTPTAKFSGTLQHQSGLKIESPSLTFSGFPAPRQIQILEAEQGLKLSSGFLERDLDFNYAYLQFRMPVSVPVSDSKQDVTNWQKSNDPIIVEQIVLNAGKVYARGSGTITLDDNLQINANINARVVGMDSLMDDMAKEQGEKTIAVARSFLNMMSKVDDKTGERYFETTLKIEKRGVYFGPMLITRLPELVWK